jgi:hypothetical protein
MILDEPEILVDKTTHVKLEHLDGTEVWVSLSELEDYLLENMEDLATEQISLPEEGEELF